MTMAMIHAERAVIMERALTALAALVRGEYPARYSLAEIADTWGGEYGVTPEQVEALRAIESEEWA